MGALRSPARKGGVLHSMPTAASGSSNVLGHVRAACWRQFQKSKLTWKEDREAGSLPGTTIPDERGEGIILLPAARPSGDDRKGRGC